MFLRMKDRLGIPGVLAVIALVFAMSGAAFAAKKYVITSTGQIKPSVLKQLKGKTGAQGQAGANGANGKDGAPGANGAGGTAGKSVVTAAVTPGTLGCVEGGTSVEVEGSGVKKAICNGEEGSPWSAGGILPSGQTATGTYVGSFKESEQALIPISFTLPVEPAPEPIYVSGASATGCPGVVGGVPTADPGKLCLYAGLEVGPDADGTLGFISPVGTGFDPGAGPTGTIFTFSCEGASCTWSGSWAVTAP
jgi:hypothetical protein